jgi:hypothetical protein
MFADIIRTANTEHEIYFLLTSYIEAVRFSDKLHCGIPEHATRLPLNGMADVRERFEQLMIELDTASKRLDDNSCTIIREGVHILGSALNRLSALDEQRCRLQSMVVNDLNVKAAYVASRYSSDAAGVLSVGAS